MPDASRHVNQPAASEEYQWQDLGAALDRRFERERTSIGSHSQFNGSTKFVHWMLGLIMLLVAAGICGDVVVYGQVQRLQGNVDLLLQGKIK